jgi:hypothetical protein
MQFVVTLKTPDGQPRSSQNDIASHLQHLINSQSYRVPVEVESLIPGFSDFEGYECLEAKCYEPENVPKSVPSVLEKIHVPSLSLDASDYSKQDLSVRKSAKKYAKKSAGFISGKLLTVAVEHLGIPVLHWIFATLANYVK